MSSGRSGGVARQFARLLQYGTTSGLSEDQLLERYASVRDEVAFEAIVARHGPMVLNVCRQFLDNPHDVEDAFQATFLVLVRKAGQIRDQSRLAQWLHGVAIRVSTKARAETTLRRTRDAKAAPASEASMNHDIFMNETSALIHQEIQGLPESYRSPVVLCFLEGLTHEQAADQLSWPVGTVKGRLARAKELLRSRLTRRGVALTSGAIAATLVQSAQSSIVPEILIQSTVKAAAIYAGGQATAVAGTAITISTGAASLAEGALSTMLATKLKIAAGALVASGILAGSSVLAFQAGPGASVAKKAHLADSVAAPSSAPGSAAGGQAAASSPAVAMPSAGDLALASGQRIEAARAAYQTAARLARTGTGNQEDAYLWSRRLLDSQKIHARDRVQLINLYQEHLDHMIQLEKSGQTNRNELAASSGNYFRKEAELWLSEARANRKPEPTGGGGAGGFEGGEGTGGGSDERGYSPPPPSFREARKDPRNKKAFEKLAMAIPLPFPSETPLQEFIDYIKQATKGPNDNGLIIYVDQQGLVDVDKSMSSPLIIDIEEVPLRVTLQLVLKQLGMIYFVKDGLVYITGKDSEISDLVDPDGPFSEVFATDPVIKPKAETEAKPAASGGAAGLEESAKHSGAKP